MFKNKLALSGTVAGIAVAAVLATASFAQQSNGSGPSQPPQAQSQPQSQPPSQSQSRAPNLFDDDEDFANFARGVDDDDQDTGQESRSDDQSGRDSDREARDRDDRDQYRGGPGYGPRYGYGGGPGWRGGRGWDDDDRRGPGWGGGPGWREGRRFGPDEGRGPGWGGPGWGGPGHGAWGHMRGHHRHGMMGCGPQSGRFVERMLRRLERVTQPTDAQRGAFDKLKQAADQARQKVQESCPTERPVTPPSRLALVEKRLAAMLDAVRTIRPAMDEYWGALSEEQKARFYAAQGWAQRWRERMFERRGPRSGDGDGWRGWRGRDRDDWRDRSDRSDRSRGPRDTDGDGWPNSWGGRL